MGFRPFVYRQAVALGLTGHVLNDPTGVTLEAQGPARRLDELIRQILEQAPALARVDDVSLLASLPLAQDDSFRIVASRREHADRGRVTVDAATCDDCLREMRDGENRRHGHALINCTNCGPRYTIVRDLPYDRPLTTMAPFPMCPACAAEYADPLDRRFHAQPTCCPSCGPHVRLVTPQGRSIGGDAFVETARLLEGGGLVAMKGLGGYHLVVDARNEAAVGRLREAKRRDEKPFAIMVRDLAVARTLVKLSAAAQDALGSPARPILLAPRRDAPGYLARLLAPGVHRLGLMLPTTPMQSLLADALDAPLVMTSANESDDPLVAEDAAAHERLAFVDAFLMHDRIIERAVDDSILADTARGLLPLRRARGYVPAPVDLPVAAPEAGLAVGGELKSAVAVVRGREAVLSQHLGDLSFSLAHERFEQTIQDLERLFDVRPRWLAFDPHPDYRSRAWAAERAAREGLTPIPVQHHHAHLASLMAEHGRSDATIGLVCDGVGYGSDGTAWGGEILWGDLLDAQRRGHLRTLRLPGGDAAARETGRVVMSWLWDLIGKAAAEHPVSQAAIPDERRRRAVARLLETDVRCPPSTGMGRLFDAAAGLLGLCLNNAFEAMSGMRLEAAATRASTHPSGDGLIPLQAETSESVSFELDTRPLLRALLDDRKHGVATDASAWRFHDALADGLARAAQRVSASTGTRHVALSGGVFCNVLLTSLLARRLEASGLEVLLHRSVPPNDGGIALGQAAVAAARLAAGVQGRASS